MSDLDAAVQAIDAGELVVYPTETVYGLGADALDRGAIERVFGAKDRPQTNPMALAVATVADAHEYVEVDELTAAFMAAFLPGPVTVIAERRDAVPAALAGGRDRVGVRVPACEQARALLARTPPLTATSANVSGHPPVTDVADLDPELRRHVAHVLDGGSTPGGSSTVVDVATGRVHRRGRQAEAVVAWLRDHGIDLA